jgi:hypothetical protein
MSSTLLKNIPTKFFEGQKQIDNEDISIAKQQQLAQQHTQQPRPQPQPQPQPQQQQQIILHEKFTLFNQLFLKKPKTLVDLIGIVNEIGKSTLTKVKANRLSLRKIKLIDKTNISVSVAFWGKQADDFEFNIGTCLMINKIQVTNYNGLSLNVLRCTEIMEVKRNYQIPLATELIEWYNSTQKQTDSQQLTNIDPTHYNYK